MLVWLDIRVLVHAPPFPETPSHPRRAQELSPLFVGNETLNFDDLTEELSMMVGSDVHAGSLGELQCDGEAYSLCGPR